jgi:hypothetical protein
MSAKVNAEPAQLETTDSINVVAYPQELTLMSEYMNDVQAKRFKQKYSFPAFVKSGLNLTVLNRDNASGNSNIIDSGIRIASSQYQPDAA